MHGHAPHRAALVATSSRGNTRAERGIQEIIPARHAYAAFSAASESRAVNRLTALDEDPYFIFPKTRRGWSDGSSLLAGRRRRPATR